MPLLFETERLVYFPVIKRTPEETKRNKMVSRFYFNLSREEGVWSQVAILDERETFSCEKLGEMKLDLGLT